MAVVGVERIIIGVGQVIEERLREMADRFAGRVEPERWKRWKEEFDVLWRQIRDEGKNAFWRLGGLAKSLPNIYDRLAEAKDNERMAKYIALIDKLSGIGWKLSDDGKNKQKWETYKIALTENWNKLGINELFNLTGVTVEIPRPVKPVVEPEAPKPAPGFLEQKIFGIPVGTILIVGGIALGGLWFYQRFIKER